MGESNSSNCLRSLVMWTMASHLKWFNIVAEYALFVLMAYLTDAWGLGFAHAAGIINIWTGFSKLLTLLGAFMVDRIGNYQMLLYSSIAYSIGLAFLYMSTPPVLDNMAGNCGYDRPECFGSAQKAMFYISLVLIAVGTAGHTVSLDPFLDEQTVNDVKKPEGGQDDNKKDQSCCTVKNVGNKLMRVVISAVSSWFLPDNWGTRFAIVAIYGVAATIAFAIGTRFYHIDNKTKERGTKINFCDMFHQTAVVWPSFIMCGVVSSIGNTFFVEQADRMKPVAGVFTVPLGILLFLSKAAQFILEKCNAYVYKLIKVFFKWCDKIKEKCFKKRAEDERSLKELAALFGIGIAMLNAVLCCLAAAVVENVRRKDTMKKYLHHDSKFWLVPQFVFVIGIDAFLQESVKDFFQNYGPLYESSKDVQGSEQQSMEKYIIHFTNFVIGLGFIGSVVSVLAVAKISKSATGKSWIQHEVTDSRLENYYWVLAVLSGINIIYYVVGAVCYSRKISKIKKANDAQQQPKAQTGCCSC